MVKLKEGKLHAFKQKEDGAKNKNECYVEVVPRNQIEGLEIDRERGTYKIGNSGDIKIGQTILYNGKNRVIGVYDKDRLSHLNDIVFEAM